MPGRNFDAKRSGFDARYTRCIMQRCILVVIVESVWTCMRDLSLLLPHPLPSLSLRLSLSLSRSHLSCLTLESRLTMLKFNEFILLTLRNSNLSNSTNYTHSFRRRCDYTGHCTKKKELLAENTMHYTSNITQRKTSLLSIFQSPTIQ